MRWREFPLDGVSGTEVYICCLFEGGWREREREIVCECLGEGERDRDTDRQSGLGLFNNEGQPNIYMYVYGGTSLPSRFKARLLVHTLEFAADDENFRNCRMSGGSLEGPP